MSNKNIDLLHQLSAGKETDWVAKAEWRKANADWLEKSAEIALRTCRRLKEIGMSQRDLAREMNVTPQYVSTLLRGSENLTLATISKIENILHIKLVDTVTENQQEPAYKVYLCKYSVEERVGSVGFNDSRTYSNVRQA